MGFSDEDYESLKECGLTDSAIYHCAGDSIITTCLVGIVQPLISNNRTSHKEIIEDYIEHNVIEERK